MLKFETMTIPAAKLGGLNSLPPVSVNINLKDLRDDENLCYKDGLFINYGNVATSYPYRYQDLYDRSLVPTEFTAAVLENEKLRAVFLPQLGGKLWSLADKVRRKELLFTNTVVRPCNLAVRNAWTSGGVEWNCGFRGHHPYTCETVNTARTALDDGTDVLRFYWYERVRKAVVQMDFWIPEGAGSLYARMRLVNTTDRTIPMYWWSNIAVVQKDGDRVIVPADQTYTTEGNSVVKIDVTRDMTYPLRGDKAKDYFWAARDDRRRYVAQVDAEGYGLAQTSTSLLKGRKLFIWGNFRGGRKWMNFLTEDGLGGDYDEIQCGLARSQYECLPMKAHEVWEWCEVYGPVSCSPERVHGSWEEARQEVEYRLEEEFGEEEPEKVLEGTRSMAEKPAQLVIAMNDGWAALEKIGINSAGACNKNGGSAHFEACRHLDFGEVREEQKDWIRLRETGSMGEHNPKEVPLSYCSGPKWEELLAKDKDNWYSCYMLGTALLAREQYEDAEKWLSRSAALQENVWASYALAITARQRLDHKKEVRLMLKAFAMRPDDLCLARETLRTLYDNEQAEKIIELMEKGKAAKPEEDAENSMSADPRCRLYYAFALAMVGRTAEAEVVVCGKSGKDYLIVPDIREGELMTVRLWDLIQRKKTEQDPSAEYAPLPYDLDFRMSED